MLVFHIDVNSAYLSWEAAYRLQHGEPLDLRTVPAVVGGSEKNRHGIVLAKSIPAKKYGIKTGEPLVQARRKCPHLLTVPPRYGLYMKASNLLFQVLQEYSPYIQRFSVDECFLDYTRQGTAEQALAVAHNIRQRVKNELGFTVNIGVANNKLLAKMASDFQKPDHVHTLFPDEVETKMWPLPVGDLFMVGRATLRKLLGMGITTIGELAQTDERFLRAHFKSHGGVIWRYANGLDDTIVHVGDYLPHRGVGNGTTIGYDVTERHIAHMYLLSLTEKVAMRLRAGGHVAQVVAISIKNNSLMRYSHQMRLSAPTNVTNDIYETAQKLFDDSWQGDPIRHLHVRVSDLRPCDESQLQIFEIDRHRQLQRLDLTIDHLRQRYGSQIMQRGVFVNGKIKAMAGGVGEEDDYKMMSSIL